MIMEPDVNDSNGYDGTLVQYGVVSYDKTTKNFPIYRYGGQRPPDHSGEQRRRAARGA